ncbi:VOC family protein [Rhizohabitans arisaemae]|uniref:VOC family protein n=1 Tax=Rhizohabitans arisaemae TaxID=2720610 RepID=UPI0024B1C98F|nr:VOC family protein [Rhizohabitans arisaemae]
MMGIHAVTFDCAQPYRLAAFWQAATDWTLDPESEPGDDEIRLIPPGGPQVLFIRVPEGKTAKNRFHLDVMPTDGRTRDEAVEHLLALGATQLQDHRRADGTGWVTLLDPEGNEFCVCRSQAERDGA